MNNKILIYIILIILFLGALISIFISSSKNKGKEMSYQDITQDIIFESSERGYFLINSSEEWESFKNTSVSKNRGGMFISSLNTANPTSLPSIDFEKNSVIAVFMGMRNTGGFDIRVKKILETNENILVTVEEISPDKNCNVIQIITYPYQVVLTPKITKKVDYKTIETIKKCD